MKKYFISCDWGTSKFRLRFVERQSLQTLSYSESDIGIKTIYDMWKEEATASSKQDFLASYLFDSLKKFNFEFQKYPLIISGMASANIGLYELPYAAMPLVFSGQNVLWEYVLLPKNLKAIIISGTRDKIDVMRGEEIQAIGLAEYLPRDDKGVLILPGTHSKHLYFDTSLFFNLVTFMSGELFSLLANQSSLSLSVESGDLGAQAIEAFKTGVAAGFNSRLSSQLFGIRAKDLLLGSDKPESYFNLSGLIIGDELAGIRMDHGHLYLAGSQHLGKLYSIALKQLFLPSQYTIFSEEIIEKSTLKGKNKILSLHEHGEK